MRKLIWISFFGLLTACDFFVSKEEATQKLVEEKLLQIDWDDVDQYPLFDACREDMLKPEQRACFEDTMMTQLNKALEDMEFEVKNDLNDTVLIDFLIDEHGFITIQNVEEKAKVLKEIENFNSEVTRRLNDLTTVAPAIKQGIPVSVRFRLPIILNTQ
ncbi:hypothetical protein [Flagellimonas meridianipacifica]|uniref:TonB-like protein n=1 Tax=Flagellimonas meridianipacifica TaxID=1080225 RepID=A0A2T0MIY9_9FLAO|nr:hypothetical protein [Allomuricauda pacifica]PRX57551.1 hypothetical protein CLV81_1557 [Allomuricauda pacifica]